jgi:hypothetical protein
MKIVMKIVMSTCKILCLLVVFMNSLLLDGIRVATAVSQKTRMATSCSVLLTQYEIMERDTQIVT